MEEVIKETTKIKKNEIQHVAALVSGILGIMFSTIWFIGLTNAIVAIVCGARMIQKHNSKMGKAGMILGIIGTVFSVIALIINIINIIRFY